MQALPHSAALLVPIAIARSSNGSALSGVRPNPGCNKEGSNRLSLPAQLSEPQLVPAAASMPLAVTRRTFEFLDAGSFAAVGLGLMLQEAVYKLGLTRMVKPAHSAL